MSIKYFYFNLGIKYQDGLVSPLISVENKDVKILPESIVRDAEESKVDISVISVSLQDGPRYCLDTILHFVVISHSLSWAKLTRKVISNTGMTE